MTAPLQLPPLPEPGLPRWQPLRIGLVELYHYDCEEFWFRDGHLLLRGNNGSGKSKVLSLTLPFLFDAHLSAYRVEPDADRMKRMDWNLLMENKYERRTGYAWIEFGRRDQEDQSQYVTLGCGMAALQGRPVVDAWHFTTDLRVGRDLWLITNERAVVGREMLAERLGQRGQIFSTAQEYRRAVDERLFHMGEDRYRALMDTLIMLRHPQLSRKPDEQGLSDALTQALSPMPQTTLEDVAEALTQLDAYYDDLRAHEALREAVTRFLNRYKAYARIQARRQARVLRQAQTEFDSASRAAAEASAEHAAALKAVDIKNSHHSALQTQLVRDRGALEELRHDPAMADATRLHAAERTAQEKLEDAANAERQAEAAGERLRSEQAEVLIRREEVATTLANLSQETSVTGNVASQLGLAAEHANVIQPLLPFELLAACPRAEVERVRGGMRDLWRRRGDQFAQIRSRLEEVNRSASKRDTAAAQRAERAAILDKAQEDAKTADGRLHRCATEFVNLWQHYFTTLRVLSIPDQDRALAALSDWTESQAGGSPMDEPLREAHARASAALADREAKLAVQRGQVSEEKAERAHEHEQLSNGENKSPPHPYTREVGSRAGRLGAPLWCLVEFQEHVSPSERAGFEAALEASGLLDAWVLPDGTVLNLHTQDAVVLPRPARRTSLREWLKPAEHAPVSTHAIEQVLLGIDATVEEPEDAEAWISATGRFRIGPLKGAWAKPMAEYVGIAAREEARRRRLLELEMEVERLTSILESLDFQIGVLTEKKRLLADEYSRVPSEGVLREAHASFSAAESLRRNAQERAAEADLTFTAVEDAWRQACDALERDARDLRLPFDTAALAALERRLTEYGERASALANCAQEHRRALQELSQQVKRESEATSSAQAARVELERRANALVDAESRRDELRGSVGVAVAEIERRLALRAQAVRSDEEASKKAAEELTEARERRAATAEREHAAQQALEDRSQRRTESVHRLQEFARTGLLAIAVPELEIPDLSGTWTIDPALNTARRAEQALADVSAEDGDWSRVRADISRDFTNLATEMSAQGHQAQAEESDFGLKVEIVYQARPERPDLLERRLHGEITEKKQILNARERDVLENYLQAEVAAGLQRLLQDAERRVTAINRELYRHPTSTGVRFKLEWQPLPEGDGGAPVGLAAARGRLLNTSPDAWSQDDRRLVGEFLHNRIKAERTRDDGGPLLDHLSRALDYRLWHRFRVKRLQDGSWRPLSGPASSGERALGLTVPLFAAASSHYAGTEYPHAPRLVLLDEAFAGIDDEARAHCMALIREFDLDFVMTSEREWGCYAELPGVAICNLVRREGIDAVFVSRWAWDGKTRREEADPSRRFQVELTSSV